FSFLSTAFYYHYRPHQDPPSFPTRRSSDLGGTSQNWATILTKNIGPPLTIELSSTYLRTDIKSDFALPQLHHSEHVQNDAAAARSEEHTSELQSRRDLVCRLLLEKKKKKQN